MAQILKRATVLENGSGRDADVMSTVTDVIADIRRRGDEAVREYSRSSTTGRPESFRLSDEQIE